MSPRTARAANANVVPIRPATAPAPEPAARPRRTFGKIMKLRSGRFQASYQAGGARHLAPVTFLTKGDAAAWLDMRHAELLEYRWKPAPPPDPTKVRFADYSQKWMKARDLSPKPGPSTSGCSTDRGWRCSTHSPSTPSPRP